MQNELPDEVIKRILQVTVEDAYAKSNIHKNVREILEKKLTKKLYKKYQKTVKMVDKYRWKQDTYYKSKQLRLVGISHLDTQDIVVEMLMIILMEDEPQQVQNVATKLAKFLDYDDIFDGVKTAAELISVGADSDIYDITSNPFMVSSCYALPKKACKLIERTRYMDPLVCTPNDWTNNSNGGYLSICKSLILGKANYHTEAQSLDAINTIQSIEWELDEEVLANKERSKKKLKKKDAKKAHKLMARNSKNVYDAMLSHGNSFYFEWRYDFRGRMYSQGYYINLQSTEYKKALLNFKHKETIRG